MIDTIILRLHGLQKNNHVIRCLDYFNKEGYSTHTVKAPKEELSKMRMQGIKTDKEIIEMLENKRTGDFLLKTQVGKQMNASNHYSFTYYVNYTKDHIEFNFSIPKYKYGSNVLLFVEHFNDLEFAYHNACILEYNINKCYRLLMKFLNEFLKKEFIICDIDPHDVEINRIDVCFNQLFKSKREALLYLEYQKRLKKKYARDENGVMRDYSTSLMYTTKRYSAKIYHKGSEYERNDKKEHEKINTEKGVKYFNVEGFQDFADRILRYELTIRNTFLNYLHKKHIFRKDCRIYNAMVKSFDRFEMIKLKNERISKHAGKLPPDEREAYLKANPYYKTDKDTRVIHRQVQKLINKRRYFVIEADNISIEYNKKTVPYEDDLVPFTSELLRLCFDKLLEFINEFKIMELPDEELIRKKIEDHNSKHIQKLPKSDMIRFYRILSEHGSFKEVAKFADYSRATIYRYLSRFKKIGITPTCLKPIDSNNLVPEAPLDLKTYHTHLLYDCNLIRGIRVVN